MSDEPTIAEQLEAARRRTVELEITAARLETQAELAHAQARAADAEARVTYLEHRHDELQRALGRRNRAHIDRRLGITRLAKDNGP